MAGANMLDAGGYQLVIVLDHYRLDRLRDLGIALALEAHRALRQFRFECAEQRLAASLRRSGLEKIDLFPPIGLPLAFGVLVAKGDVPSALSAKCS